MRDPIVVRHCCVLEVLRLDTKVLKLCEDVVINFRKDKVAAPWASNGINCRF